MKDLSIFENKFDESSYKELVKNLFNRFDFSKELTLKNQFNEAEKLSLEDFTYLGTFEDAEKKSLDVLIVELKGGSKVERARSLQRNLIGKYLKGNLKDSALVAFYSKDNPDWRLSFVKMEFKIGDKGAKVEIGTPPKRYSFLVGETEPSYTAKKQLLPFLDDKVIPIVDGIEEAFSIEKVTEEFYTQVAIKFTELVGGERKVGSKKIVERGLLALPSTNDDTTKKEFAVRLIGRLLFCWFLRKKKSDNDIPLISPAILSFTAMGMHSNYYHSLLEPLFFQVLNTPMEKRNKRVGNDLWNKIPFLNGGLFEPHQHDFYVIDDLGTSKHLNTLKVPDEWFAELFKIFEEYNFTIDESSTIDIEISVDPEMLGRIFENLLAEINPETGETVRKSTGSYYTPRPIVEYMVDESLKQYLITQTEIEEVKIAKLLSYAEDDIGMTETEKDAIIDALDRVKIIDPACGSGAFLMGILYKMLLILQKIDPKAKKWLNKKIKDATVRRVLETKLKDESWDYIRKLGIIRDSIYGVDIQLIAVEISKLRFFLSLVVDELVCDDEGNRGIEPLPNLEFKFVAANSLIRLPKSGAEGGLAESHGDIEKLRELREEYFTAYGDEKRRIEKEFKKIQSKMLLQSIKWKATGSQTMKLSEWNPFEDKVSSWFDPEWMFGIKNPSPLVGDGKGEGGFDIVIANPPYVKKEHLNEDIIKELQNAYTEIVNGKQKQWSDDLYVHFIFRGVEIVRGSGIITYITNDSFIGLSSKQRVRRLLLSYNLMRIIRCPKETFNATIYTAVFLMTKEPSRERRYHSGYFIHPTFEYRDLGFVSYEITDSLPDERFIFAGPMLKIYSKIVNEQKVKGVLKVLDTGIDSGNVRHKIFFAESEGRNLNRLIQGRQIERYGIFWNRPEAKYKYCNIYYIPRNTKGTGRGGVPSKHNENWNFRGDIENHHQPERLLMRQTADNLIVAYQNESEIGRFYTDNTLFTILSKDTSVSLKYASALLNSSLVNAIYRFLSQEEGKIHAQVKVGLVEELPFKKIPEKGQKPFIEIVDKILAITKSGDYLENPVKKEEVKEYEKQIDRMIYKLYDLTPEEINIVENFSQ